MKMVCISKDGDTAIGLRLSGIESYLIKEDTQIKEKINELAKENNIGIIVLTENVFKIAQNEVNRILSIQKMPLIVTIPSV